MSDRLIHGALQANDGTRGDYSSSNFVVPGIGVGIYVGGTAGDVSILTKKGTTLLFTAVPQGTHMQVPLFTEIVASGTGVDDLTVSFLRLGPDV